ncbi:MAG: bifunctional nuclease family protein [Bacteroidetes bacterium]|nr:bifunctional nuclease family protein [Bacteroidota bacterium]
MEKVPLDIVGLSYSQTQTGAYALVLGEAGGKRRLPIIIGAFEAQAIAMELEKMQPSRPLTHDLFKSFAETFNITVSEVVIYNLVEGIFYAKLVCSDGAQNYEIDARTSDAIALAIRFACPIYTFEFILSSAGIILEDETLPSSGVEGIDAGAEETEDTTKENENSEYHKKSSEELKSLLSSALEEEHYELAAKIRDELNKRKQS